ncbi:hypothetical protein ACFFX0_25690 [Citricoccus parietis]|uniref:Uncharacterized protein n=1 Tax=Citricoccus parietis TaxID=592307 RepID=A0ABV5G7J7_9MICC
MADHGEPVGGVPLQQLGGEGVGRFEPAHPHRHPRVLHRAPQDADRPTVVDGVGDDLQEPLPRGGLTPVTGNKGVPRLGLGLLDEGDHFLRKQAEITVVR